ncbi:hypothetical protein D3869_08915 [Azospirillum brasilense]|uniref:Uncharacterized protein n=1 Tax=Azospirillum brasilense TaxID=192 RepID=A0A4D8R1J0_AZOBR|nr:hypothetical protein D3869_08915 [Azospirillum brasilense]
MNLGERENAVWDAIGVDNNLLMKELVSRSLTPIGDAASWTISGVAINARLMSAAASKVVYRYVFIGQTWRCDFDAVYNDNFEMNKTNSHILWTVDQNVRPRADGACRVELRDWLTNALGDNAEV